MKCFLLYTSLLSNTSKTSFHKNTFPHHQIILQLQHLLQNNQASVCKNTFLELLENISHRIIYTMQYIISNNQHLVILSLTITLNSLRLTYTSSFELDSKKYHTVGFNWHKFWLRAFTMRHLTLLSHLVLMTTL